MTTAWGRCRVCGSMLTRKGRGIVTECANGPHTKAKKEKAK
jgi:hypothetical protein